MTKLDQQQLKLADKRMVQWGRATLLQEQTRKLIRRAGPFSEKNPPVEG